MLAEARIDRPRGGGESARPAAPPDGVGPGERPKIHATGECQDTESVRALARWENEGGSSAPTPGPPSGASMSSTMPARGAPGPMLDDRSSEAHSDIADRDDVEALLREFYGRAFADPLLGPIFRDVARMDLDAHLPVMCDFWQTVLFRAGLYRRNALRVHAQLHALSPLSSQHFARWLALWTTTIDDSFAGEKAELAKTQAIRIAYSISRRLLGATGSEFVTIARRPRHPSPPQNHDAANPTER